MNPSTAAKRSNGAKSVSCSFPRATHLDGCAAPAGALQVHGWCHSQRPAVRAGDWITIAPLTRNYRIGRSEAGTVDMWLSSNNVPFNCRGWRI